MAPVGFLSVELLRIFKTLENMEGRGPGKIKKSDKCDKKEGRNIPLMKCVLVICSFTLEFDTFY